MLKAKRIKIVNIIEMQKHGKHMTKKNQENTGKKRNISGRMYVSKKKKEKG